MPTTASAASPVSQTIEAAGAPHDCLEVHYAGGDKLFLPVENIELLCPATALTKPSAQLDRLGGVGWQSRKARMKQRIREMAERADQGRSAARAHAQAPALDAAGRASTTSSRARFPYEETEDQHGQPSTRSSRISAAGRPMDRLICGDVGFGKTEVALRAAFIAALDGKQVAVVVPTTLLARQHFQTFTERFQGFPVKIAQASRLVHAPRSAPR